MPAWSRVSYPPPAHQAKALRPNAQAADLGGCIDHPQDPVGFSSAAEKSFIMPHKNHAGLQDCPIGVARTGDDLETESSTASFSLRTQFLGPESTDACPPLTPNLVLCVASTNSLMPTTCKEHPTLRSKILERPRLEALQARLWCDVAVAPTQGLVWCLRSDNTGHTTTSWQLYSPASLD